jgi:para-aminobenzoate synthetase component 1
MKHIVLPSTDPAAWIDALNDDAKQPCVFTSNGDGWKTTVAWNPDAQLLQYGNDQPGDITGFVRQQTESGRKVLGYVSYDMSYGLHGIPQTAHDDLGLPCAYLLAFGNYLEITSTSTTVFYNNPTYLEMVTDMLPCLKGVPSVHVLEKPFASAISRELYGDKFRKVKRYITDGDVYQINLTHRLESSTRALPREVFARISTAPTNFMAYMEGQDFAVHSASPERFVRIRNNRIDTFPIKGTRPRGNTPQEDRTLRVELVSSEKDKAELNMITDLLRNDLGKVCQSGTVELKQQRAVLQNATVMHTFSHITGMLLSDVSPVDAFLSMFPGGSITGCPKKRAMEIIDELEPQTRSVYCGSFIVVEPNGDFDSSIAIRTLIQKGERLVLQVGGGIVDDSNEEDEYQETWHKAQGVIKALK